MAPRRRSGLGDRYYPAAPWLDGPAHFRTITRPACGFGVLIHHRVFTKTSSRGSWSQNQRW